jgi:hypothetical protein
MDALLQAAATVEVCNTVLMAMHANHHLAETLDFSHLIDLAARKLQGEAVSDPCQLSLHVHVVRLFMDLRDELDSHLKGT